MTPTSTPAFALLDIDADGETEGLTDGRLVLRYLFGFRGAALTGEAVDDDCTRCLEGEIESYLGGLAPQLDVDDSGELEPLTDGMLVLRWLFDFRDDLLVAGAVDPDQCDRCLAADIEEHLQGLDP